MVIGMKPRLSLLCALGLTLVLTGCAIDVSSSSTASSIEESSKATSQTSSVASSSDEEPDIRETTEETTEEDTTEVTTTYETSESEQTTELTSVQSTEQTSVSIPDTDAHWDLDFSTYGKTFMVTLGKQIQASGKLASYDECKSIGPKAAAYPNANSSTFIPFYHEAKDSEKTTYSSCNREHTWPKSRGGKSIENDPVMIRPALSSENSDRGNDFYGIGSKQWDPASCGYEGARGESARIILYCAAAYSDKGLSLSNNPNDDWNKVKTMGTLKTLLKWNREYAPTEWEKTVNNRYDEMGYRRNPFVDHPEYAEWIWDDNGLRTIPYGGDVPVTSNTSSSSGGTTSAQTGTQYDLVTDLSNIGGQKFVVTAKSGTSYYNLTAAAKSDSLPWYLIGDEATVSNGKMTCENDPVFFTFAASSTTSGAFNITAPDGKTLFGYVVGEGEHYSIGLANSEQEIRDLQKNASVSKVSKDWEMESISNGTFQLKAAGVYLEYFKGSFCGYNKAPSDPIMLFH